MELNKIALASNEELEAKLQEKVITSIIKRELITLTNLISQLADTIQKIELKHGEKGLDGLPGSAGKDGLPGKDGVNGIDGKNGLNGKDGVKGDRGNDGKDGISIVNAEVTFDNHLVISLSDGNEIDAGVITVENKTNYVTQIKGEDIVSYSSRYDQVSTTLAYKGEAIIGASESAPLWRIQKLVYGTDGDVTITWATGTTDFRFNWTDRATLTYI